jgi:hypothetical protein
MAMMSLVGNFKIYLFLIRKLLFLRDRFII